jgi:hypothetical protein
VVAQEDTSLDFGGLVKILLHGTIVEKVKYPIGYP